MKKILILGCNSFSGSIFIDFLLTKNYQVYGTYSKKKEDFFLPFSKNKNKKNLKIFNINFLNKSDLMKLVNIIKKNKPNYIIDFASICDVNKSWDFLDKYFQINVQSKAYLIDKIYKFKFIKKFIYISTPEIFGSSKKMIKENSYIFNPSTPYATSKLAVEKIISNYSKYKRFPGIITRFSNFYGTHQDRSRLIPQLIISILHDKKFNLDGDGSSLRNFIYQDDFCEGIFKVMNKGKKNKIYHFSGNKFHSIKEIVKLVCKIFDKNFNSFVKFRKDRLGKDYCYKLDCRKTKKELDWKSSVDLSEGITKIFCF
jgi:dTDP-glucose 4,6-dehydratase